MRSLRNEFQLAASHISARVRSGSGVNESIHPFEYVPKRARQEPLYTVIDLRWSRGATNNLVLLTYGRINTI